MEQPAPIVRKPWETWLARIMFGLSVVFLVHLSALLHRDRFLDITLPELQLQVRVQCALWLVFFVEGVWRLLHRDRSGSLWRDLLSFVRVLLFPPLRVGARSVAGDWAIWLPWLGWQPVDRELRRRLERFFSVPMILIALLVLPLLAIQYYLLQGEDGAQWGLTLFLIIGNTVVWFAFAAEFTLMMSVAKNRLQYCFQHWIDLAIIVLPLLQMVPYLPLLRLIRLSQLYRLQGLTFKLWRAVLLLEVIQRMTGQSLEKRLKRLNDLMAAKEEELEDLRREIEELRKRIAAQKQGAVSGNGPVRP